MAGSTPSFFQDAKKINVNAENTACGAPAVQIHNRNVSAVFRKSWAQEQGYGVLPEVDFDPDPPVSLIWSQGTWDLITFQSLGRFALFEDYFLSSNENQLDLILNQGENLLKRYWVISQDPQAVRPLQEHK